MDSAPGRTVSLAGEEWLYLSGTSYLGMHQVPAFSAHLREGLARYGANFGGSRLGNLQFGVYAEAEAWLARYTGAEAALTLSSGSVAGHVVLRELERSGVTCHLAPGAHPALWLRLPDSSGSYEDWVCQLLDTVRRQPGRHAVLANALDPLYARAYDFSWLSEYPSDQPLTLVIDDSHSLGICGRAGAGTYSTLALPDQVQLVVVSSLGKAFGLAGGVVLASGAWVQQLWRSPFFGGASPMPPAYLHALLYAQESYAAQRARLKANIARFCAATAGLGLFSSIPRHPVFHTTADSLAGYLAQQRALLSQFHYPSPNDPLVTRLILNALHTEADIDQVSEWVKSFHATLAS